MLVFVIPLKSRKICQSWERTSQLLERTVRSVCNQTIPNFRAIVVCNEKPDIEFQHPHLTFIEVDFPEPKETNRIAKGLTDKGRKVLTGLTYAKQFNPTYAMSVDSDDCISNRLGKWTEQHPTENGWYINRGYKYREGDRYIYIKRNKFYTLSGTANIIRFDLLDLPENPEYNRGYGYYKFHLDHQKVKRFMLEKGKPIKPLPFPGSIYILGTGDNMSGNEDNLFFNFLTRKTITPEIRQEFTLYNI
ncbi:MAG: glycosyltransferase family 2 protein [Spirulina sp.]